MLTQKAIPKGFHYPDHSAFNLLPSAITMVEKVALVKYRRDPPLAKSEFIITK